MDEEKRYRNDYKENEDVDCAIGYLDRAGDKFCWHKLNSIRDSFHEALYIVENYDNGFSDITREDRYEIITLMCQAIEDCGHIMVMCALNSDKLSMGYMEFAIKYASLANEMRNEVCE